MGHIINSRDADLSLENNAGFSSLFFINKKVPQCMRAYEDRLDLGLKLENTSTETSAKIKMDFNKLSPNINSLHRQDIAIFRELIKSGRADLIKHPLSQVITKASKILTRDHNIIISSITIIIIITNITIIKRHHH